MVHSSQPFNMHKFRWIGSLISFIPNEYICKDVRAGHDSRFKPFSIPRLKDAFPTQHLCNVSDLELGHRETRYECRVFWGNPTQT